MKPQLSRRLRRATQIAKAIRLKWETSYGSGLPLTEDIYSLVGYCEIASSDLLKKLRKAHITGGKLFHCTFHSDDGEPLGAHVCAVLDKQIIDITATQFGRYPRVYLPGPSARRRHYKNMEEYS